MTNYQINHELPLSRIVGLAMEPRIPRITIGITCYAERDLLYEAWNSVVRQTSDEWECILINDASKDKETNRICDELRQDPRLHFIRLSQNGGLSVARNAGVIASRTDVYLPLDADDRLPPHAVEVILNAFDSNPHIDFVYGKMKRFGAGTGEYVPPPEVTLASELLKQHVVSASPFRRSMWQLVGGYDLKLSWGNQDWDFWLSALERGAQGLFVDSTLLEYRVRPDGMHASYGDRWPEIRSYMYRKHRSSYDRYGAGNQFQLDGCLLARSAALERGDYRRATMLSIQAMRYAARHQRMKSARRVLGDFKRRIGRLLARRNGDLPT